MAPFATGVAMRAIALEFLFRAGLALPLRADEALAAARFWPLPSTGPAWQDGNILRYDETRPTWQVEVWAIVCGRLLAQAGLADTPARRAALARHFGVELDAPRLASVRVLVWHSELARMRP